MEYFEKHLQNRTIRLHFFWFHPLRTTGSRYGFLSLFTLEFILFPDHIQFICIPSVAILVLNNLNRSENVNFCVRAKRECILIMSISDLYIKTHTIEKARCHRISGCFGSKPLFHVIASQFKVAAAWELEMNKS